MINLHSGKATKNPKGGLAMSKKQTDKTRTHAPNADDKTPKPNKSDRYISKESQEDK
jgi:hypothetical protein